MSVSRVHLQDDLFFLVALDEKVCIAMSFQLSPRVRNLLFISVGTLFVAYVACGAFVWHAMLLPPQEFGAVMARMPSPAVFLLFPFETLWTHARAGTLKIGEHAPDFSLLKVDKSGSIQLSALNQQQPVVLIFGSYT
jgi:hypothetical protein